MPKESNTIVTCDIANGIATIVMDDGRSNAVTPELVRQLNAALDKAEAANAVVVLTGREDVFCAGFDLKVLKTGVVNTFAMLIGGFELSKRLLSFPTPVVIACNGHALAMGVFLLLSGDYRVGVEGAVKIVANEVEIGLTMPHAGVEICRQRLKPACFDRAVLLSELFNPQTALEAGFLDQVVPKDQLYAEAQKRAQQYASLNLTAHRQTKLRMRREMLNTLGKAIRADKVDFVKQGVQRVLGKK